MHEMSLEKTFFFKAILKTIYEKNMLEFFPWRQEKKRQIVAQRENTIRTMTLQGL